jgi:hypothetical protein
MLNFLDVLAISSRHIVAKRHRAERETMLNPTQAPGAARSVGCDEPMK